MRGDGMAREGARLRRLRRLARAVGRLAGAAEDAGHSAAGLDRDECRDLLRAAERLGDIALDLELLAGAALEAARRQRRAERVGEAVELAGGDGYDAEREALEDERTCVLPGCGRRTVALGLCDAHRQRAARGELRPEDPIEPRRRGARCSSPGCERPHKARGLCSACYAAARRAGRLPARTATANTDTIMEGIQ